MSNFSRQICLFSNIEKSPTISFRLFHKLILHIHIAESESNHPRVTVCQKHEIDAPCWDERHPGVVAENRAPWQAVH